jgi:lauroyl/myristoyl acyltransferase
VLARTARALPPATDPWVAGGFAWVARRFRPERERAARENAARLFPNRDPNHLDRLARGSGVAYARFVLDYFRAKASTPEELMERNEFGVPDEIRLALGRGRGLVVCAAHVGHWELGAVALARLGRPVTVVARPQLLPSWSHPIRQAKEREGIRVTSPRGSAVVLARTLREGGIVALLVDGSGFEEGRPAQVAGQTVFLPSGPARLAARTGAILVGGTCLLIAPGRYRTELVPLAGTGSSPVRDADRLHASIAIWLEQLLLSHPGEWCVFRRFFEKASAGPRGRADSAESAWASAWERG